MDAAALDIRPLRPELIDDLGTVLKGSWGAGCWCIYPRLTDRETRELPGSGKLDERRRVLMVELAGRSVAPGLVGFADGEPAGWVAVAPRVELGRIVRSRATPPVDDRPAWVIPCVTVARSARGRGIAVALIQAAVAYAASNGATVVEAYPRAGEARVGDANAYYGTEPMFRQAGFAVVRGPLENAPKNWTPRVAMRTPSPLQ